MRTFILGVPFDTYTFKEALDVLSSYLEQDDTPVRAHACFTPNPEMVMAARKDAAFMAVLNEADLVVPDGIGIVIASRLKGRMIKERVSGCDLTQALFENIKSQGKSVYLLGGKPGVNEKAKAHIEQMYAGLTVAGFHHGYFDDKDEISIVTEIQACKPDILLVGLGFPRQEKWIAANKDKLPVKVAMGIGGTLDVLAGTVKRAPVVYQKLGLEWLYRLAKQPSRLRRAVQLPLFMIRAILSKR